MQYSGSGIEIMVSWYKEVQSLLRKYPPHAAWTADTSKDVPVLYQMLKLPEIHQTRQRFSILLLSNFGEPVLMVAWVSHSKLWPSAAVAHLLQGSTCCEVRDSLLDTLVVTSGYLSDCCFPVSFKQSGHSLLFSVFFNHFILMQFN